MAELKPCPFCGESEMLVVDAIDHGEETRPFGFRWTAKVVCLNCFASCGTHGFRHNEENGKRMAIRAWNTRTQKEVKDGEWINTVTGYVCSVCHEHEPTKRFLYCPNCGAKMDGERKEK